MCKREGAYWIFSFNQFNKTFVFNKNHGNTERDKRIKIKKRNNIRTGALQAHGYRDYKMWLKGKETAFLFWYTIVYICKSDDTNNIVILKKLY